MEIIKKHEKNKPRLKDAVLIEGLPGIGNVSKLAIDFLVSEKKAKKYIDIHSDVFPHSVFVDEKSVAHLPKISISYLKGNKNRRDIVFVSGDVQATSEKGSYHLSNFILKEAKSLGVKEIITLGGIGRKQVPKKQGIHLVVSNNKIKKKLKKYEKLMDGSFSVSMILGAAGLILGLGEAQNISGFSILVDTFSHPSYLDYKGARKIVAFLNDYLKLKVNPKDISEKNLIVYSQQKKKKQKSQSLSYIG